MRICLITTEYFNHGVYGGIGAMARQKATALAQRGVEVYVVTPRKKGQQPVEVVDGVTVLSYPGGLYTGLRDSRRYSALFRMVDADIYHTEEPCMGTRLAWEGAPAKKHSVTFIDPRTLTERRKEWQEAGVTGRALWDRTWSASLSSAITHPVAPGESAGMPAWVITIWVRPSTSVSSTRTSVVAGCPSGMPIADGASTLPCSSDIDSV